MKIGIVTVQDSNNFGSFLQAYALQHVLQEMGHDVVFIRTRSKQYLRRIFFHMIPSGREWLHPAGFLKRNYAGWKKYCCFQKELRVFRVIESYNAEHLDMVILGSDEIWNTRTPVFRNPIFYGAGMEPVMAYAVSIGNAEIQDMSCIDSAYFHRIDPILARDAHTVDFLHTLQIDAPIVCDPTLLADKAIFKREFHHPLLDGKPFLLVYTYGLAPEIVKNIRAFADAHHLRILSACFSFPWCDGNLECTALDFCSVLEKAEYVFTSTFHGTIFSILNRKQFVSMPQSRKTSDLLDLLQLSAQLIGEQECCGPVLEEKLTAEIDYPLVEDKLSHWRKLSVELLNKGICRRQHS